MHRAALVSLPLLFLGACVGPVEHIWDPETFSVEREDRTFAVRAQYDPLELAWFTRVYEPDGYLSYDDRALAIEMVEAEVGPQVCDGNRLQFQPGQVWNADLRLDDNNSLGLSHYMEEIGEWRIVAECT